MSPVKSPVKTVVEKDEVEEELIPGWTKEVRIRKSGSETKVDRYYTDPVTGYIFHSFRDVQRYLKTGEVGRLARKPKVEEREKASELKEQTSETLRNKRAPTDKFELPARALKRIAGIDSDAVLRQPTLSPSQPKTRQARRLAGIEVEALSPSQSLLEHETRQATRLAGVAVDASPLPPEPKTREATRPVEVDVSLPSPSPPEPKTRQATRLAGLAVDASLPSPALPEPKTRQATRLAEVAVDASLPLPSPPEPKTRQAKRLAGVAVDASLPSPPEPKSRQATRLAGVAVDASLPSPPEPKTRQATQLAGMTVDVSLPSLALPEPKTRQARRLAGVTVDASQPSPPDPKTRQATRLAGVTVDALSPSRPEPKTRQATRLSEVAISASLPSPSHPKPKTCQGTELEEVAADAALPSPSLPDTGSNRQATKQNGIKIDASPAVPKTRQAGIKIDSPPPLSTDSKTHQATHLPEPKTRQAKRASEIRDNASPLSPPQPKTRRATQQAGIKINTPPTSLPDTRNSHQAIRTRLINSATRKQNDEKTEAEKTTDKHNENADMDASTNHNQENSITIPPSNQESIEKQELRNILPPVTTKEHIKQIDTDRTTLQPPESQPPPTVVPPVTLQKQESPVVNPSISNPVPQNSYSYGSDMKPDSSINFSMNDLWTDPCIEFAVKTLTGAIPLTDLNKVENFTAPVEVPLEELWTDPCIEFAVKTLTGAIPIGEDDYLRHRPSSSTNPQAPHNFSSPMNVCQTGHKNMQHESVFPTLGNGGLQKSVKFVNGSNGQCSRPRFFQ